MEVLAACATDDGISFCTRPFSDAGRFVIYRIGPNDYEWIKAVDNPARPKDPDAPPPPNQPQEVAELLARQHINVLVGLSHDSGALLHDSFVQVRVNHRAIGAGIFSVMNNLEDVVNELPKSGRSVLELE